MIPTLRSIHGVHQLLSRLVVGDAMGNHAIALQRLFLSWGLESKIFSSQIDPNAPRGSHRSPEFDSLVQSHDVAILHYGAYSPELQPFSRTKARRVLAYHNITPPRFFLNHGLRHYYETAIGRLQLPRAVREAEQCWADSAYNKHELAVLEATDCRVVPLLLDFEALDAVAPDVGVLSRYSDGVTNVVSIGRLVPNKRQDHVISAFARYRRDINPRSRLLLVGSDKELGLYRDELRAHVRRLQIEDSIVFTGHIATAELLAYYRVASVLLCLSEHEGFGAPLVEAMHFGVPVVALARAAVPDTLRGAGVLIDRIDFDLIAAAIHRVCADSAHRERVLAAQRQRLREFAPTKVAAKVRMCLQDLER